MVDDEVELLDESESSVQLDEPVSTEKLGKSEPVPKRPKDPVSIIYKKTRKKTRIEPRTCFFF